MGEKIRLNLGAERHKTQDVAIVAYLKRLEDVSIMVLHNDQFNTMLGEKRAYTFHNNTNLRTRMLTLVTQIKIASPL